MKTVIHLAVGIQQEAMQMELSNILQQKVLIKKCSTYYYWTSLTYISYFSNQQNYRWKIKKSSDAYCAAI